jgi:hypothetical protein
MHESARVAVREVTVSEAARLTGLSKTAIARRLDRGSLNYRTEGGKGGRRFIPVAELYKAGLVAEGPSEERAGGVDDALSRLERVAVRLPELIAEVRAELAVEREER